MCAVVRGGKHGVGEILHGRYAFSSNHAIDARHARPTRLRPSGHRPAAAINKAAGSTYASAVEDQGISTSNSSTAKIARLPMMSFELYSLRATVRTNAYITEA